MFHRDRNTKKQLFLLISKCGSVARTITNFDLTFCKLMCQISTLQSTCHLDSFGIPLEAPGGGCTFVSPLRSTQPIPTSQLCLPRWEVHLGDQRIFSGTYLLHLPVTCPYRRCNIKIYSMTIGFMVYTCVYKKTFEAHITAQECLRANRTPLENKLDVYPTHTYTSDKESKRLPGLWWNQQCVFCGCCSVTFRWCCSRHPQWSWSWKYSNPLTTGINHKTT